jgi:hypothetical protein
MPCHVPRRRRDKTQLLVAPAGPVPQGAGLEGRGSGSDVRVDFCFVHQYNSPRASETARAMQGTGRAAVFVVGGGVETRGCAARTARTWVKNATAWAAKRELAALLLLRRARCCHTNAARRLRRDPVRAAAYLLPGKRPTRASFSSFLVLDQS